jgi:dolichyl-phosphate beta-glucosyltransferase
MLISFLIPIYNEEKRVGKAIKALSSYLGTFKEDYEVLFIDDGSTDSTVKKIASEKPRFQYRVINYQPNKGKGYAIRQGMMHSRGDYKLFFDVDMSTPLTEFDKFLRQLHSRTVLIGNRKTRGAEVLKHQPYLREKMGQAFTLLARLLTVWEVTDFTCGFKCYPKEVSKKVFKKARVDRWSYDAEILFLTKKLGFKIKQVPVTWKDDDRTRVVLMKDSLQSLVDLLKIRLLSVFEAYN